jgi:hypothetical protein
MNIKNVSTCLASIICGVLMTNQASAAAQNLQWLSSSEFITTINTQPNEVPYYIAVSEQ